MSDKMVTLHLEFDEEMGEADVRAWAREDEENFSYALDRARVRAARKLFPEYRCKVGQPYEVTFDNGPSVNITRLLYRVEGGWTASKGRPTSAWHDDKITVHSVREVTVGGEVK